jgi:hypothetical protein
VYVCNVGEEPVCLGKQVAALQPAHESTTPTFVGNLTERKGKVFLGEDRIWSPSFIFCARLLGSRWISVPEVEMCG